MRLRVVRRAPGVQGAPLGGDLHPVLERVYAARGVRSAADLDTSLARLLPVGTLEGIAAAVDLLLQHRTAGRVLIIGDFDADGATSSALMVRALRSFGFAVGFLVPNRFQFGYGLTPGIVSLAAARAPTLIVTVDNGISSNAGVAAARARGIDVLITDHHLPGVLLPDANVIVNPNLGGSRFGSRALAGVGVAFYVMAALARRLEQAGLPATGGAAQLLDLVALGTVADLVPLDANNRVLVAQGLKRIRAGRCVAGIRALLAIAGRPAHELTASDLAFGVAPRLNAAGRLDDMSIGIQCLLEDDLATAEPLAARLDELNRERRSIEARMQQVALGAVRCLADPGPGALQRSGVCLFDESWHQGVVGLVASRVKDRLRRPVIAFALADRASLRGSARSVAGIHIRDVLDSIATRHPDLIERFGGHAMAAGVSLERAKLDRFARAFDEEVARWTAGAPAADTIETDGELAPAEIALDTAQALRAGGPWGQAFPEPCFDGLFSIRSARVIAERHVKMWVEVPASGRAFDAMAFNHLEEGAQFVPPAGLAQLVYRLEVNEYQGERRLQLLIDHLLPAAR
ncbi:MAG: single-stranded-DNA-specific exonuclease RecJ [Gammaproteobacteria bacterium]|nr:MAG: single-stranded-DNA-specific exonuclease RecJ [Gammaproteobacteria bacterium]TLZ01589.1 MAG: single-stranded-DNA-specific exonuclease RecJ [Gammaproteobacteria bacterium]TLZ42684.1 MAG: single-stranded-DNA-specific exonuclease RecJ [Gammaproteobacteria bacterium]